MANVPRAVLSFMLVETISRRIRGSGPTATWQRAVGSAASGFKDVWRQPDRATVGHESI